MWNIAVPKYCNFSIYFWMDVQLFLSLMLCTMPIFWDCTYLCFSSPRKTEVWSMLVNTTSPVHLQTGEPLPHCYFDVYFSPCLYGRPLYWFSVKCTLLSYELPVATLQIHPLWLHDELPGTVLADPSTMTACFSTQTLCKGPCRSILYDCRMNCLWLSLWIPPLCLLLHSNTVGIKCLDVTCHKLLRHNLESIQLEL